MHLMREVEDMKGRDGLASASTSGAGSAEPYCGVIRNLDRAGETV